MTNDKSKEVRKDAENLKFIFRMNINEGWRQIAKKENVVERVLKKLPFGVWSKFFEYFILPHFCRGQIWMYDSLVREVDDYYSGDIYDDEYIKRMKDWYDKNN